MHTLGTPGVSVQEYVQHITINAKQFFDKKEFLGLEPKKGEHLLIRWSNMKME